MKIIFSKTSMFLAVILIFMTLCAFRDKLPSFDEVFNKAKGINPAMKDCQAKLNLNSNVHMYIPLRFQMNGDYYYKAPDKYKIKLKRTPSYLKKHPQVFSWALPDAGLFHCKVSGIEKINNSDCYLIELTPRQGMGDLIKHKLWIDLKNYAIAKQTFLYINDGEINVVQNYKKENNFWVFDNLCADFYFPKINLKARVEATYTNYLFNQNLPDSLFAQE